LRLQAREEAAREAAAAAAALDDERVAKQQLAAQLELAAGAAAEREAQLQQQLADKQVRHPPCSSALQSITALHPCPTLLPGQLCLLQAVASDVSVL
jgi:hypothetical protein